MIRYEDLHGNLGCVRIAHHISGRIRLKLQSYPEDLPVSEHAPGYFQAIAERMPGIHSVRVNILARSCLVEYDPAVIPDQAWKDFIAGNQSHFAQILEQILRATYQEITHAPL